ncbi:MAG TPA: DUF2971 domain-containing protein [Dongiaceae bacterium]|nr:DUF2971 domain-containing protein [Dongiaceae bacterium]
MEPLYHYCSAASFHGIVSNASIWLSAMTQSNDSLEGKLVLDAMNRCAQRDKLGQSETDRILWAMRQIEQVVDAMAICMSTASDLLSQWRGYAQDGTGFAIGFRSDYIRGLTSPEASPERDYFLHLGNVLYSEAEHIDVVENAYQALRLAANTSDINPGIDQILRTLQDPKGISDDYLRAAKAVFSQFVADAREGLAQWFFLKPPAFVEEREVRLMAVVSHPLPKSVSFRLRGAELVPYRSLPLDQDQTPIAKVMLGPKNPTPERVVEAMLRNAGFGEVVVQRSAASYR